MRVLINYDKADKSYLPILGRMLTQLGCTAFSTTRHLSIGELLEQAKAVNASAILLNHPDTLHGCVPGEAPTVDKWRGSRLNFSIPVIVINRLEHVLSVPHGMWLLERDVAKLKYINKPPTPFGYSVLDTTQKFHIALGELSRASYLVTDIETATATAIPGPEEEDPVEVGDTLITCSAWTGIFPDGALRTYVLPFVSFWNCYWKTPADYAAAFLLMKRINALPQRKIMHNGMYDSTHLIAHHCEPFNYTLDTMAMAHAEYAELPKTLDFVASYQLYDYIFWKDDAEAASKSKDIQKYWGYNARDTWHTARVFLAQMRTAPAYAFKNYRMKFKTTYPALYCNFEGLAIDQAKRIEVRTAAVNKLEKARASLRVKFANPEFNPGSWQQVQHYIYKIFGAVPPKIGKSKAGTDDKNLKAVAEQHPLLARLTSDILDYREAQKAIGTYYDFMQKQGRLVWALNPYGTETERMAASASSFWCGTQVQNIPGYAKVMLIADPGYELFEADNKQSEGRTTAYLSQEEALIAALEDAEKDFYKTLGTLFFGIPYEKVTKVFRNEVLKKIVHGTNYMMGAGTFIENIGAMILFRTAKQLNYTITDTPSKNRPDQMSLRAFAKLLLDSYHKPFPRIRKWYQETEDEIHSTGYLVSPLGHTRKFFGDIKRQRNMLRSAVAHRPQNLSVAILDIGFNRVYQELVLPGNGDIRAKAQIHDSIFGQIRLGMREYYAPRIIACMDNPVQVHGRTLRIPVDIKFGQNWAERSDTNPSGTVDWKG